MSMITVFMIVAVLYTPGGTVLSPRQDTREFSNLDQCDAEIVRLGTLEEPHNAVKRTCQAVVKIK